LKFCVVAHGMRGRPEGMQRQNEGTDEEQSQRQSQGDLLADGPGGVRAGGVGLLTCIERLAMCWLGLSP
jgi:hypothetical protein